MQSKKLICDLNKSLTLETGNEDFKEFAERIKTYIEDQKWIRKPSVLSPPVCSQLGWKCSGRYILECVTCQVNLCVPDSDIRDFQVYGECVEKLLSDLTSRHSEHCPWRITPAPDKFVKMHLMPKEEALLQFVKFTQISFNSKSFLPRIKDGVMSELGIDEKQMVVLCRSAKITEEDAYRFGKSIVPLSATGWTVSKEEDEMCFLKCNNCLRSVYCESFSLLYPGDYYDPFYSDNAISSIIPENRTSDQSDDQQNSQDATSKDHSDDQQNPQEGTSKDFDDRLNSHAGTSKDQSNDQLNSHAGTSKDQSNDQLNSHAGTSKDQSNDQQNSQFATTKDHSDNLQNLQAETSKDSDELNSHAGTTKDHSDNLQISQDETSKEQSYNQQNSQNETSIDHSENQRHSQNETSKDHSDNQQSSQNETNEDHSDNQQNSQNETSKDRFDNRPNSQDETHKDHSDDLESFEDEMMEDESCIPLDSDEFNAVSENGTSNDHENSEEPPLKKKRVSFVIETGDTFDPLREHRPWCMWVTKGINSYLHKLSTSESDLNNTSQLPGWKIFVTSLLQNTLNYETMEECNRPSREKIRIIRSLVEKWGKI